MRQRIACISTSRADAGIYRPLLRRLTRHGAFEVALLAGGTHHEGVFGGTGRDFSDLCGLDIIPVEHFEPGENPLQVARTAGRAVSAFAEAVDCWKPDVVFVLGDRTEMLSAALALLILGVPIAHLHGGDVSEGAVDEQCRHAITKLSHLHFPALPQHAERIAAMGEPRWRIHVVGAPALDALNDFVPLGVDDLRDLTGVDFAKPSLLVLFHPETLSTLPAEAQAQTLLDGLTGLDAELLILGTNADVGHERFRSAYARFAASHPSARVIASLSQLAFWSCLTHARCLVGNSSAGILEAASFRLPVVNVGNRQAGRFRPANVLDAPLDARAIRQVVAQVLSGGNRWMPADLVNPYGDGRACDRILRVLEELPPKDRLLLKRWAEPIQRAAVPPGSAKGPIRPPRRVAPG